MKIYACLVGNWVCLNDDPDCVIGPHHQSPDTWLDEGAIVWAPSSRTVKEENSLYNLDHVQIRYKGDYYRISPIFIQTVNL